jgi:penicillin amidase
VWKLANERPEHLLDPRFPSWQELLLAAVDQAVSAVRVEGEPLERRTWGERNTLRMRHPLSGAVPGASRWLDMPSEPLPGDAHMPRVQGVSHAASERMAVSPGREAEGYLHMPGGQSGHPWSPHYRDGHAAWVEGKPQSFLPTAGAHALVLEPATP